MADAFIDSKNLDIGGPGSISIGEFATTKGSASYRLVNETDDDVLFDILVQLTDTAGNKREFSQTSQVVSAHGDLADSHELVLRTNYSDPGRVTATLRVEITGAASFSDSVFCEFDVN
jgi:hypothetical protein